MRKIASIFAFLALMSIQFVYANEVPGAKTDERLVADAQRYAPQLPQTVVVRRSQDGAIMVYHSAANIPAGVTIDPRRVRFEPVGNSTPPRNANNSTAWWGNNWYFYWNYSYPTYGYGYSYPYSYPYNYPSYYYYGYNYYYQPYYNYYSYPYYYNYYGWRW